MTRRTDGEGSVRLRSDGRWEGRITLNGTRRSYFGKTSEEVERKMTGALASLRAGHRVQGQRRRSKGEGTVRQREDGRWEGRVTIEGKRFSYFGKTPSEVTQRMRAATDNHKRGFQPNESRERLDHYLESWLTVIEASVSPSTFKHDAARIRNHIIPALGKRRLTDLTPADIEALMAQKLKEGLSSQTVIHLRGLLRRALGRAVKHGMLSRNVAALADPPRLVRTREPRFLDPEEAQAFLEVVRDEPLEALWTVYLMTGLRRSEALALRWQDVDFRTGTLTVSGAVQYVGGQLQVVETKTAKSRRRMEMPQEVVEALRRHRAAQVATPLPQAYVFSTRSGRPLGPRNVNRSFDALLKRAGLEHIRLHDLRHSFASLLLASGEHPRTVMELLGHSQIGLTMNTYSHVMPALKREAMDRLSQLLSDPNAKGVKGSIGGGQGVRLGDTDGENGGI